MMEENEPNTEYSTEEQNEMQRQLRQRRRSPRDVMLDRLAAAHLQRRIPTFDSSRLWINSGKYAPEDK